MFYSLKTLEERFAYICDNCGTVDPDIFGTEDVIYFMEKSNISFATKDKIMINNKYYENKFKENYLISYYRSFEKDYFKIDFFKYKNEFIGKEHLLYQYFLDAVRNFDYICKKMTFSHDEYNYILYDLKKMI